jgi:hypothetical protein
MDHHAFRARTTIRQRLTWRTLILQLLLIIALAPALAHAQGRVGSDSSSRMRRYWRDLAFGGAEGFAYAGVDQLRNDPVEWGKGWHGYERRLASDVGEFVVQETVTDVIAAGMDRQLDYQLCHCHGAARRIGWALQSAITDPLADGHRALAIPRIVGAYAGSFAQAAWRPVGTTNRTTTALVNGTSSLIIGAGINLYYELRHR